MITPVTVVAAVVVAVLYGVVSVAATPAPLIMPWMCLQRCGATAADIKQHLAELADHGGVVNAVSFERFNLGANSTLVRDADLFRVGARLHDLGLPTVPMVSLFPYTIHSLPWVRELFANPTPFIEDLLGALTMEGHSGVNIDFEPSNATAKDAQNYALFLGALQTRLAPFGFGVSVDVADWSAIWNLAAIAAALRAAPRPSAFSAAAVAAARAGLLARTRPSWHGPRLGPAESAGAKSTGAVGSGGRKVTVPVGPFLATMSTYTGNYTTFLVNLQLAIDLIGMDMLTVGLMIPANASTTPVNFVLERFAAMTGAGVTQIAVWRFPIPPRWWGPLQNFANGA